MKIGIITILGSLLLALPALAGECDACCGQPDADGDSICDPIDNCHLVANPSQLDGDQDGYGNACDCDLDNANFCDTGDFLLFGAVFGTTVPPTNCEFDMAPNGFVDTADFLVFGAGFGAPPGPACGNAKGTPCASPGAVCP